MSTVLRRRSFIASFLAPSIALASADSERPEHQLRSHLWGSDLISVILFSEINFGDAPARFTVPKDEAAYALTHSEYRDRFLGGTSDFVTPETFSDKKPNDVMLWELLLAAADEKLPKFLRGPSLQLSRDGITLSIDRKTGLLLPRSKDKYGAIVINASGIQRVS